MQIEPACYRCKYILHGQSVDADCPECGTPIADSFRGYRPSRRHSLLLLLPGLALATLTIASFFVNFHFDLFSIFDDIYLLSIFIAPFLAVSAALVAAVLGARFHRIAVILFILITAVGSATTVFFVAQAAAGV